ncbi:glycosyltransferase family 2 protein [bacterium]|nr:glycosyltransferase family 2 protein [bacterium]
MKPSLVSIVIPALNEQESLTPLTEEIEKACSSTTQYDFELIFVDDGSRDNTWKVMHELAEKYSWCRAVRLRRNFGKATALAVGIEYARGEYVMTLDADLQDDPLEGIRLLGKLSPEIDLICGWKINRRDSFGRRFASKIFNFVTGAVFGTKLHDGNCGLKVGRSVVFRSVPLYGELHRYIPMIASGLGFRVAEDGVVHRARSFGKSKYGLERIFRGAFDLLTATMITKFRQRPGHLFGGIGVLFGIAGLLVLTYMTILWFFGVQPIGTRPLFFLGILLLILGVHFFSSGLLAELILHQGQKGVDRDEAVLEIAGLNLKPVDIARSGAR